MKLRFQGMFYSLNFLIFQKEVAPGIHSAVE